jgi:hypothetical protein
MALRTTTTSSQRSTTALTSTRGRGAIVRKTALQSAVGGQGTSAVLAVTRPATVGANLGESFVVGSSYPRRRWTRAVFGAELGRIAGAAHDGGRAYDVSRTLEWFLGARLRAIRRVVCGDRL